ncbi:MAG TPA: Minf_1886 family protein [Chitinispirillaceae bacterium]|nr:Minf_1886 family protein [Chitinispirillaceae bacterium]
MAANQVLDHIRKEIIDSEYDTRYKIGAYDFVLNGLEFYLAGLGEKRHVSGQEFSMGLLQFAQKQFGLLAMSVLNSWGVTKTDDFGHLVYNMIGIGLMSRQPNDAVEDFFDVIEFKTFFDNQEYFEIDTFFIKKVKGA